MHNSGDKCFNYTISQSKKAIIKTMSRFYPYQKYFLLWKFNRFNDILTFFLRKKVKDKEGHGRGTKMTY